MQRVEISQSSWTNLGYGPLDIQLPHLVDVLLHFGELEPAWAEPAVFIVSGPAMRKTPYGERVWIRLKTSGTSTATASIVTYGGVVA